MKKRLCRSLLLCLALALLFSSCAQAPVACGHTDRDGDFLCDHCREALPRTACTVHADDDGDLLCDACAAFVDERVAGWLLSGVPCYRGGILSTGTYMAGQGLDAVQPLEKENTLQTVSKTSASDFSAYLAKLELAGYEKEYYREADGNLFAAFCKKDVRVCASFMSRTGVARILKENAQESASLAAFAYTAKGKAGAQSTLYQFALAMNDETHEKPDFKDNGMLYLLKLADDAVVIIDGANSIQMTDERRDDLMRMLWEITGKKEGDTVRIAAWYVTHAHTDHYGGFLRFSWKYAKYLSLERVFFALPSLNSPHDVFSTGSGAQGYRKMIELINESYADDKPLFLRLHSGQSFALADATFEVLQTHEDLVDPVHAQTQITNYNDASSILRVTLGGASFLFTGDAGEKVAMPRLLENWSQAYLRTDGIQLAHHAMNDLTPLYRAAQSTVLFVPQSPFGVQKSEQRVAAFEAARMYARADMIFFQSEATVGISAVDGRWERTYFSPFAY